MTTVREALTRAAAALIHCGVADAEREAAWLLAHVLQTSVGSLRLLSGTQLDEQASTAFDAFVERRARREPIAYILGTEEFMGLTFRVSPAVLIPRVDTEVLVRTVLGALPPGSVRVADIGTGSGAIAVALATHRPDAAVVAVDLSQDALKVARDNARAHGVQIDFRMGDLLEPLGDERFDAIVSNPPYIGADEMAGLMPEVRQWEPHMALTPGEDALVIYRRLCTGAPNLLDDGGCLAVEVGAGQAEAVAALFSDAGLTVSVYPDSAGINRVVKGRK